MVIKNTPWQEYMVDGKIVHVKREDMSCPEPGPRFSKIRGLSLFLDRMVNDSFEGFEPTVIGVVDSIHSKAGWGTAYLCKEMDLPCVVFYPYTKEEGGSCIRHHQLKALSLGAELVPLPATKSAVLWYQARKIMRKRYGENGLLLPNGLKLSESVEGTAKELLDHTPYFLYDKNATWVVSVSSGTIAAGVLEGLGRIHFNGTVILHCGYSRSERSLREYVKRKIANSVVIPNFLVIDEGYAYADKVKYPVEFPCNPYYDLKAWKWFCEHKDEYLEPYVFWNIGA